MTRLHRSSTTQAAPALKGYALEEAPEKAAHKPAGSSIRKIESQQRDDVHKPAAETQNGQDEPPPKAQKRLKQEERPLSHELGKSRVTLRLCSKETLWRVCYMYALG